MEKDGKALEQLVRNIETRLLPEGFTVECNERVYEDGVQIAEFDIVIAGPLGSTTIKWLLECRDRPSDGPAPGSWIEQLVARRSRFNFDKVFAISTTGFAQGAIEYAAKSGVVLRTVQAIQQVGPDFEVCDLRIETLDLQLTGQLGINTSDDESGNKICNLGQLDQSTLKVKPTGQIRFYRLKEFARALLHQQKEIIKLEPGVHPCSIEYRAEVQLFINDDLLVNVSAVRIPVRILVDPCAVRAIGYMVYAEADRVIAKEWHFEIGSAEGPMIVTMQTGQSEREKYSILRFSGPEGLTILPAGLIKKRGDSDDQYREVILKPELQG